ncbi:MAG: formylglycine-generating enzyme family protein [Planctomycetota bacterium]|nr:formylglycine-generating enzyme family protein [Planctomycetota bacterium]MDA1213656.1 formylglycine-generating enzyme family protein [Planctomycetota bacterium]
MQVFMAWSTVLVVIVSAGRLANAEDDTEFPTQTNATDGAVLVVVPDGEFQMGSSTAEVDEDFKVVGYPDDWKKHAQDELPAHQQRVKSFLMYRYEVTNSQYRAFCEATGHQTPEYWLDGGFPAGKGDHPVVQVSWHDAQEYCDWAGTRLPTEAEWEFAARGESENNQPSRKYPWGNEWDLSLANSASFHAKENINDAEKWKRWYEIDQTQYPLTSKVGQFDKCVSPFGLYDMAGNAWEWCADEYALFEDRPSNQEDKANDSNKDAPRVTKGGSWANVPFHLRSADRNSVAPDTRNLYIGFRCAKDL